MRLGDLDELKKAIEELAITEELVDYDCDDVSTTGVSQYLDRPDVLDLIDNAPTVDLWQMRQEATENALKKAEVLYGRPQGEWIPVSERLPEIATTCLVQLSNGYITMGKYHSIRGGSWVFIDTTIQFVYPKDSVIAWRPLPEPYKEGDAK